MGGREDFDSARQAIMAAKRDELGGPPTPEELLAYRDGLLDPAVRQSVEERLAIYPEAARALAALAAFPDLEAEPETPEPSKEEMDVRWRAFRQRLETLPKADPRPPAPSPERASPGRGGTEIRARERREPLREQLPAGRFRRPALPFAAAALLALAVGFFAGRASRPPAPAGALNVTVAELEAPDGGTRSVSQVEVPDVSEELLLVLGAPAGRTFPDYGAEILRSEGAPLWSRQGLRPTELGTFHLSFLRDFLPPGSYEVRLFGREGGSETLLATYELRLVEDAESD